MPDSAPHRYTYRAASSLTTDDAPQLGLRTSGPEVFLDGFAERADVLACGLLAVADVARTPFWIPPGTWQRRSWSDPILTAGDGVVRFESLSPCSGVAARLDLLADALDLVAVRPGTTNIDVGNELRHLLAQVRRHDPLRLVADEDGLDISTLDGQVHERTVELPERWVRSLAELQVLTAAMVPVLTLDPASARRFIDGLPRQTPGAQVFRVHRTTTGLRLGTSPVADGVRVVAPERLRVLGPLLRLATGLRVYGPRDDAAAPVSSWELTLPGARLVVTLSPAASRGFSGEGAGLDALASGTADAVRGAQGLLGYDLAEQRWFDRRLPFAIDVLRANPRLDKAHRLIATGAVTASAGGASDGTAQRVVVRGTTGDHLVRLDPDGADRCTCAWYGAHQGDRGPCAHVLAARLERAGSTGGTSSAGTVEASGTAEASGTDPMADPAGTP